MGKTIFYSLLFVGLLPINAFSQSHPDIRFIENKNQWPDEIDFAARVHGGNMFVRPTGFSYVFLDQRKLEELHNRSHTIAGESLLEASDEFIEGQHVKVTFIDSNPESSPRPMGQLSAYYNYFLGDPSTWASGARSYAGITYDSVYQGISLHVYSSGDAIKYDFIVHPHGNPAQIKLGYEGADVSISQGDLWVSASFLKILEKKPAAFQHVNGKKVEVACAYSLADHELTFSFPNGYDESAELIIDPLLIFSTYSGSTADNWGSAATPGEKGFLYSAGATNPSAGGGFFPATTGAFQRSYAGMYDIGILKYDSTGSQLLYASYLGGSEAESPHSLVVNSQNELVILGTTSSANFPTTTNAFQKIFKGGTAENNTVLYNFGSDIFVTKISADGTQLLASTFLGGTANDGLNPTSGSLSANYGDQLRGDVLTDAQGEIYISTVTASANFPVSNGFDLTYNGGATDALILKLNADLSQIRWATFLGGNGSDASHTIKFDKSNNLFAAGGTTSSNFPMTSGTFKNTFSGVVDGWIANITQDGSTIISSTFTGTSGFDQVYFLDLNSNDDVYAYGQTTGNFPVTAGVYHNNNGGQFLQKFSHDLKTLVLSTVFGSGRGVPDISPTAFLVNDCNNIYMSGWGGLTNTFTNHWPGSSTFGMPITSDALQKNTSGSDFYFIVLTEDASQLLYSTYLGGTTSRTHVDGGTSRFDKGGIVYHAVCAGCAAFNATNQPTSDFPTTPHAWSRTNNSFNCNNAAFKFDLSSLKARIQTNTVNLKNPGITSICINDKIVFQNRSIGGKSFTWTIGDGLSLTKPDTSAVTHQYLTPGFYTVKLKATDTDTCIGKDSTTVVIHVNVPQGAAGPDQILCGASLTTLVAQGGVTYSWVDLGGHFTSSLASPAVEPSSDTQYFVTIKDTNGCTTRDTVKVHVVPRADLTLNAIKVYDDCFSRPSIQVVNPVPDEAGVYFDFGDGSSSTQSKDIHHYQTDGVYTVRMVKQVENCTFEKDATIPVKTLFVPNVITPDADGVNDVFKIRYGNQLVSEAGVKTKIVILNRWGAKVYENNDYRDNWGAEGLPSGTYYYEVTVEGETTCKNWVQVIR